MFIDPRNSYQAFEDETFDDSHTYKQDRRLENQHPYAIAFFHRVASIEPMSFDLF